MEKLAALGAQIVEPNHSKVSQPEQKVALPGFEDLAAHPHMELQADRDDEFFDGLGEDPQDH